MEHPESTEKSTQPVSAIDGARIRALRESKKLTQLYVASVVGVTTDTISRWENNRYPTIKRENAEKLAAALEVELEEILRREAAEEAPAPPPQRQKGGRRLALLIALAVLALLAAAVLWQQSAGMPAAERQLPRYAAPGEVIPVQVKITRRDASGGLIVRERLPAGWRLVQAVPPATGQAGAEEVRWLLPSGSGTAGIHYTVRIPLAAALQSAAVFSGEVVAQVGGITRKKASSGDRKTTVAGLHWADRNGDGRIDDEEIMPAYYLVEEMKGLELDWKTVEAIWSGKGYRWDSGRRNFQVLR